MRFEDVRPAPALDLDEAQHYRHAWRKFAESSRILFNACVEAGFNEEQAMDITIARSFPTPDYTPFITQMARIADVAEGGEDQ